jgi:hypothetical protein
MASTICNRVLPAHGSIIVVFCFLAAALPLAPLSFSAADADAAAGALRLAPLLLLEGRSLP